MKGCYICGRIKVYIYVYYTFAVSDKDITEKVTPNSHQNFISSFSFFPKLKFILKHASIKESWTTSFLKGFSSHINSLKTDVVGI